VCVCVFVCVYISRYHEAGNSKVCMCARACACAGGSSSGVGRGTTRLKTEGVCVWVGGCACAGGSSSGMMCGMWEYMSYCACGRVGMYLLKDPGRRSGGYQKEEDWKER